MSVIWPFKRVECKEVPKASFEDTKTENNDDNKIIVTEIESQNASFGIEAKLSEGLRTYFTGKAPEIDYCCVMTNRATRTRKMQVMAIKDKSDEIRTPKNFLIGDISGVLEIELFAVLANDRDKKKLENNQPYKKGTILATWPKLSIHLEPLQERSGDDFPTEWVSFREKEETAAYTSSVHYMDFENDRVLINNDLPEELRRVLQSNTGGNEKALREAFFAPVAVDICEQIARKALVMAHDGGIEELEGHYRALVEELSVFLTDYPDKEDAINELNEIVADSDRLFEEVLSAKLPLACQEYQKVAVTLNRHVISIKQD